MPRDLRPLVQTDEELDALAEITPSDVADAFAWGVTYIEDPFRSLLDAPASEEPQPAP